MSHTFYYYKYLKSTKIVSDYLEGQGEIGQFFAYPNFTLNDMKKHSQLLEEGIGNNQSAEKRKKLTDILTNYNKTLGCTSETMKNIKKLQQDQCKVVVTGQQAALLTGSAFVIYKAMTTILLAAELEKELKTSVVPVFWIASEDHDFLEVNSCHFSDKKGKLDKYTIKNPLPGLPPVGNIPVGQDALQIIEQLLYRYNNNTALDLLIDIKKIVKSSSNLAEFYGKIMTKIFGKYGLVFFDPMIPEARILTKDFGEKIFNKYLDLMKQVDTGAKALNQNGYEPVFLTDNCKQFPMFFEINGQREPIYINNNRVLIGKQNPLIITYNELYQNFLKEPERFSPNAFLRPIVQDYLFPTVAYVAGPGEINYLAQLKGLYRLLGENMPVIFPRARVTLISAADYEELQQKNLMFPLTRENVESCKNKLLLEKDCEGLFDQIDFYHNRIFLEYEKMINLINSTEASLKNLTEKNYGKLKYQLNYLKEKVWQRHKKKNNKELQKLDRIYNQLHPKGKEQEMVINIISLYEIFGLDIIEKLMQPEMLHKTQEHKLVVIRGDSNGTG